LLDPDFVNILRCPASGAPLALLERHRLRQANRLVETGALRHTDGRIVATPMEQALVTRDGVSIYPVRDGIPILLLDEAIPADQLASDEDAAIEGGAPGDEA
jgi:uncharacterized protein YbaR (Trm112 family)